MYALPGAAAGPGLTTVPRPAGPEQPAPLALPPVQVLLPDRTVNGRLVRRWQTYTGEWIYVVALRAWASLSAATGSDLTEEF